MTQPVQNTDHVTKEQPFLSDPHQKMVAVPVTYLLPRGNEKEIELGDLIRVLWRGKWLILLLTALMGTAAGYLAVTMRPVYQAQVLLAENTEDSSHSRNLMSQYDGLASMAGINIGQGPGMKDLAVSKLQSRIFIHEFIKNENLLPLLLPPRSQQTNNKPDDDLDLSDTDRAMQNGVNLFKSLISVTEDHGNNQITLIIEWHNRQQASLWANLLVDRINQYMRTMAIQEADKNITYLTNEAEQTPFMELRKTVLQLLEAQVKKKMLAKVRSDYIFKVIDPAVTPSASGYIKPKRWLIIISGLVLGGIVGILAVFLYNAFQRRP